MTTVPPKRTGCTRLYYALLYSLSGLNLAWRAAPAFRLEVCISAVLIPLAFYVGQDWMQVSLLLACVVLVLVAELLNTGIESAIDRIGPEWHVLSKQAKDVGSAAVFLSMLLCAGVWGAALWHRWG